MLRGWILLTGALALLAPAAPGYDAWAWLVWGREVWDGALSTAEGPAWKPLPVAVTTLFAPLGGWAPELWLVVALGGAVAAVMLAFRVGWRLGGGSLAAGLFAAGAVVLTGGFARHAAVGDAEPLLVALALGAIDRALVGRHRQALALGALAALVRPEAWPFVAAYALWRWREDRAVRPALAALAVAVPAAWFVPEWLGSGELLRSSERARIPNPGQPATADIPALETLTRATAVVFIPTAVAALWARGPARLLALAGAAWILLVAAMSQAGFSGEERYLLPGAALLGVAGAAALPRALGRERTRVGPIPPTPVRSVLVGAVALLLTVVAAVPRVADIAELGPRLAYQAELAEGLERVIADAGGRERLRACGDPAVGRYRGTLLAWHLDVAKKTVRADGRPGDVTFSSRLTEHAPLSPPTAARATEPWAVSYRPGSACRSDSTPANRSPSRSTRSSTWPASKTSSSGSSASKHARTSSQLTGVDTVGRSFARSE